MSQTYPTFDRPLAVLHVDDDPMNLRVVDEILSAFGHRGFRAASGQEALARVADQVFDVVLMDIHMPGMGGVEAVQRLRAMPAPICNLPVIALTADVVSHRPSEYRALGFDDFVAKPILVAALMTALKTAAEPKVVPLTRGRRTA